MNPHNPATPKSLTASENVLALFAPSDNVAILVRHRHLGHTLQRITKAEVIAAPEFQSVLLEQNRAGADIYVTWNRTGWFVLQNGLVQIEPTKERRE